MSYVTMVMDNGFTTICKSVVADQALEAAIAAWADSENIGCQIVLETSDGFSWYFNPEQHERFVSGPVEKWS